jgi:two-component system, chemotaxis family, chemotaxis protein CheY
MAKIMIVDDSAYARRVHRAMLEHAGHAIVEASSGHGAIETFSLERPDVVILDLSMADLGGVQVLQTLRLLDAKARVIVVSADIQRSTERAVMDAGAERFVAKPANAEQLCGAVADVMRTAES